MFDERQEELERICKEHPIEIPVTVAAAWLGVNPESLRISIVQGRCGFPALSWTRPGRSNSGYHIPTATFYKTFSVR